MNVWNRFPGRLRRCMLEWGLLRLSLLGDRLRHALDGEIASQTAEGIGDPGTTGRIRAVAFCPNYDYLAHGTGRQVRVLHLQTSSIFTCEGHRDLVTSISWSPGGARLASASSDGTVKVWEVVMGRHLFTYTGHRCPVRAVAWSPDGTRLASAGVDGSLHIWSAPVGDEDVVASVGQLGAVTTLSWSPDGTCLLSGGADGTVCLWDPEAGTALHRYKAHEKTVWKVAWCPDADRLLFATAGADGYVQVWSAENGTCRFTHLGHTLATGGRPGPLGVVACAWTPDGRRIVSADLRGTVQEWSPPLDAGQALVVVTIPVATFAHGRSTAQIHDLDVRTPLVPQNGIVTQMAVAVDDQMYVGPSPADPSSMLDDACGGRQKPLQTVSSSIERGG